MTIKKTAKVTIDRAEVEAAIFAYLKEKGVTAMKDAKLRFRYATVYDDPGAPGSEELKFVEVDVVP